MAGFRVNYIGNSAWIAHARGKIEKAEAQYRKAIGLGSTDPKVFGGLSGICIKRGDYQEAFEIITEGIEKAVINPKNKTGIKSLTSQYVLALWKLGRLDEAVSEMEKIHEEMPSANSYGTLGYLYIEQGDNSGDYSKALEFNKAAVEYMDDDAVILDNLAQVYYRLGDLDGAEEYFRKALEESDKQAVTKYYLAKVMLAKGNREEAMELVEKVLAGQISTTATITREMAEQLKEEIAQEE